MKKKGLWATLGFILIITFAVFGFDLLNTLPEGGKYEEGKLRVWATWGDDRDQLQLLFDRYTQATGQIVKVATGAKQAQITDALRSDTPPDIIILSTNDLVGHYHQQNLIKPLNAWIDSSDINLDDIYPIPLAQCQMPDGTLVCLPWIGDTFALYWNKDLFAAAGLDPEKPPQTMEEMLEMAKHLTVPGPEGYSQTGFIPDFPRSHLELYTHMFGGGWNSSNGTQSTTNAHPVIDALNWQFQFYKEFDVPKANQFVSSINHYQNSGHPVMGGARLNCQQCHRYAPGNGDRMPDHAFYNEQVAMMVDGAWQLGSNYLSTYAPELNYGVAPFPPSIEHTEYSNSSIYQGAVLLIPSGVLEPEAAVELLAWMMSPEIVAEISYATTSLPSNQIAAKDPRFQQITHFQIFIDLMAAEKTRTTTSTPINEEINTNLVEVEKDLLHAGGTDFIPQLENLHAEYNSSLGEMARSQLDQ